MKRIFICFGIVFLYACSSTKFYPSKTLVFTSFDTSTVVYIYSPLDSIVKERIKVGNFMHYEGKNMDWSYMMKKIEKNARENGANVIKITYYNPGWRKANFDGTIKGRYYRVENENKIIEFNDSIHRNTFENNSVSWLHIFRNEYYGGFSGIQTINIFLNDSLIGKIQNRKSYSIKISQAGKYFISSEQNYKGSFPVNVQLGNEYYVNVSGNAAVNYSNNSIYAVYGGNQYVLLNNLEGKVKMQTMEDSK